MEGFALHFMERVDEIAPLVDSTVMTETCGAWENFYGGDSVPVGDSGI